ncbi:HNH endonuclease signature motif containing protein [Brevibacterium sp. CSND-B09]|uniref:HNH endonuclease signature motif containing protein n=1 Tax=Brevibacterium sp. CSND-B09 TaxID=3462571 RepID=UPI00406A3513
MTMTSCLICGEVSQGPRCEQHRIVKTKTNTDHVAFANNAKWKNLSKRLRKKSPFCEICGTAEDLTIDHIVRAVDRPEWVYEIDNCRVLCRYHNGVLAGVPATPEGESQIAEKIRVRRQRRLQYIRGGAKAQEASTLRSPRQAKFPSHTPTGHKGEVV